MGRRFGPFLGCVLFFSAFCAGCGRQDEITRYSVPRTSTSQQILEALETSNSATTSAEPDQMLAAIVPRGSKTWFLKLQGPESLVHDEEARFSDFLHSLSFSGDPEQPDWKLPEGWRRLPGTGMRYATLQIGPGSHPLELTVIPLATGREGLEQYIVANINRWRGQLALPAVGSLAAMRTEEDSGSLSEAKLADGTTVTRVSLVGKSGAASGPHSGGSRMLPPSHPPISNTNLGQASKRPGGKSPLTYDAPAEWKPGKVGGMRQAAFEVIDGDRKLEITAISLSISGGDRLANINRWRGQLKLPPLGEKEMTQAVETLQMDAQKGDYVEMFTPDGDKPGRAVLGVIVDVGKNTWFFKVTGDADLAKRERSRFKAFVATVKFSSQPDAKHEQ